MCSTEIGHFASIDCFRMNRSLSIQHLHGRYGFETEILCVPRIGKALRVIPRGKHRLAVYRAHQVTRRAFSALRVIRLKGKSTSRRAQNDS